MLDSNMSQHFHERARRRASSGRVSPGDQRDRRVGASRWDTQMEYRNHSTGMLLSQYYER